MQFSHQHWLLKSLELAKIREGFCAPNPSVGAVVVKQNQLIGEGFHWAAGHSHAEVGALNQAGDAAKGADLYVSLEPCCHYGRTPPCTERIIASGISRVFFGFLDPNPKVAGKGMKALIDAGISCEHIPLVQLTEFYAPYAFWTLNHRPFVTAKIAVTADGFIANIDGSPIQITGKECQLLTHQHRLHSDAILSTTRTIITDDPQLNVRLDDRVIKKSLYLLDSQAQLPLSARVFDTTEKITIFHSASALSSRIDALTNRGVRCVAVPEKENGLDLEVVLKAIAQNGVYALWVEAGAVCFSALMQQKLLQRALCYVSDKPFGKPGISVNFNLKQLISKTKDHKHCGDDAVYVVPLT